MSGMQIIETFERWYVDNRKSSNVYNKLNLMRGRTIH